MYTFEIKQGSGIPNDYFNLYPRIIEENYLEIKKIEYIFKKN